MHTTTVESSMEGPLSPAIETDPELLADGDNLDQQDKITDHYDAFMKKHLQHYGYYTGQNAAYRDNFHSLQEWRKNYDVRLSGHHDLCLVEDHFTRSGGSFPAKLLDMPSVFSTEGNISDEILHRTTQLVFHYQAGRKIPKLREPRNLYALTKEAGPQQATRWPSHLQVVCPAIRFIDYIPPVPFPLCEPTGKEPTPAVRGPQMGEMIYYNDPGRDLYFMRSRVAGCRMAMRTSSPPREYMDDNLTLDFESRFESGNLLKVDKITDFDYELTLRTDLYTNKHTQWFFFRVRNMRPERTYRFTIINLMKPSSLYNQGMKPVFYSEVNAKKNKIGWIRSGSNIRYYRNNMCGRDGRTYYSLTWTCEFPYKDDCCYFAHCFPYTYSDLQEYLLELANDPVRSRFCKQRVLTRTLAGNLVYILTITSPSRNPEISQSKRAVVITARVHPGETNASWMMKGFLDYLTSSSADAKLLRDTFIFKIVPMLNPDGVIVGNYRCSLAGRDLNRNYKSVLKDSFPSIWHTKMMIKRLNAERQVVVYCDLHGHSRKNNIFIYGCENKHDRSKKLQERVFPLMLAKNAAQVFSFESCKYKVQKSKEGTGRIVVWYMGVMNSYTMEATFGGTSLPGDRKNTHLSTRDLEMMGYYFCDTLLDYCDPDASKIQACMKELQDHMKRQILKRLQLQNPNMTDIDLDEFGSDFESDTSGSDSSCDDGLPVHLLAIAPKLQRKKKFRSKRDRGKIPINKSQQNLSTSEKQPNQSNKIYSDKSKSLRYSQSLANGKRKEDRQPAATAIVDSMANEANSGDKSGKKFQPGDSNEATKEKKSAFMQFSAPPNDSPIYGTLKYRKFLVTTRKVDCDKFAWQAKPEEAEPVSPPNNCNLPAVPQVSGRCLPTFLKYTEFCEQKRKNESSKGDKVPKCFINFPSTDDNVEESLLGLRFDGNSKTNFEVKLPVTPYQNSKAYHKSAQKSKLSEQDQTTMKKLDSLPGIFRLGESKLKMDTSLNLGLRSYPLSQVSQSTGVKMKLPPAKPESTAIKKTSKLIKSPFHQLSHQAVPQVDGTDSLQIALCQTNKVTLNYEDCDSSPEKNLNSHSKTLTKNT